MNRNTKPSVHQVADFFLSRNDPTAGDVISNLKLQKLCYFAQAISLAENDTPIFEEEIQAWAHGPVMPELYKRFKKYGWQAIDPTDLGTYDEKLNGKNLPLLKAVWAVFSPLSAKQSQLTLFSIDHLGGFTLPTSGLRPCAGGRRTKAHFVR